MIDNTKWTEIYKEHSKKMFWVCKRYVNDASLAEDLMHEGFIAAMQKQHTFSGFGSFEGWLRTIMVNTSLMYLRKNKSTLFVSDIEISDTTTAITDMNPTTDIKSKIINTDFTQQELLDVVEAIPEHHKVVFNMFVIDNFSHNEISKTLNITTNTSKSHLFRARKKIQELLFLKANEKEEKKDKKRLFFWFLFSGSYIDSIYAKGFSYSQESPSGAFNIEEIIQQQQLPESITSGYFLGITFQKLLITTLTLALIIWAFFQFLPNETVVDKDKNAVDEVTISNDNGQKPETNSTAIKTESLDSNKANEITNSDDENSAKPTTKEAANTDLEKTKTAATKSHKSIPKKSKNKNQVVIKKIIDTVYVYK